MYIKIYFGDKPLFLCNEIDNTLEPYVHHDDTMFIDELNLHTVKAMIHEMQLPNIHAGVFLHPDLDELSKAFFKKFTQVTAAGGLVSNEANEYLLIFRRGKWDLPKGKLDEDESIEECALREVKEETGIRDLTLGAPLMITYHTYHEGSKFILKNSHWYTMTSRDKQELVPQEEEGITKVIWADKSTIPKYLGESFPSVADVLKTITG